MNWQKEFSDSIKTTEDANKFFDHNFKNNNYPIFIPRSFAKKILASGKDSPLWKQFLPDVQENEIVPGGLYDPIGDKAHSKGHQIIHRYQNRILFTPTTVCPVLCRYCFRKNELTNHDEIFDPEFDKTLKYLNEHSEINEIIFSGGDPLILSNAKISFYLEAFSKISSVKYIRFHTRTPIIIPNRIDQELITILKTNAGKFKKLMLMIHVNHPDEIDSEVKNAINILNENQIALYSQTVLLKGINDQTEILKDLFMKLVDLHVSPYYLHHPDQVLGGMHFYLNLGTGRKIFAPLHNLIPGWALPQYVIDIPGGAGKINAFNPETFNFSGNLIDKDGNIIKLDF